MTLEQRASSLYFRTLDDLDGTIRQVTKSIQQDKRHDGSLHKRKAIRIGGYNTGSLKGNSFYEP